MRFVCLTPGFSARSLNLGLLDLGLTLNLVHIYIAFLDQSSAKPDKYTWLRSSRLSRGRWLVHFYYLLVTKWRPSENTFSKLLDKILLFQCVNRHKNVLETNMFGAVLMSVSMFTIWP